MFKVSPAAHGRRGRGDVLFLGGVAAIAALGVLFVYSASSVSYTHLTLPTIA